MLTRAWSYSALKDFLQCPRKYQLMKVTKEIPFGETSLQIEEGKQIHKALEDRLLTKEPLPEELVHMESFIQKLETSEGNIFGERKMTIDAEFKPVSWFDKGAWCRGIADVGLEKQKAIWIGDYKTGKRWVDSAQLKLFAALAFYHNPELKKAKTSFIWLKEKKIDNETYTREQLPEIWKEFMPKLARLERAYEEDKWQEKPGPLCAWCPAKKHQCKFSSRT